MIAFLRFISIFNAAIWFGSALFLTVAAVPSIVGQDMTRLFGAAYAGLVAQAVVGAYFAMQYWCGAMALLHQLAEWVYLGKRLHRLTFSLLLTLFGLGLVSGLWLQPELKAAHRIKHAPQLYRQSLYTQDQIDRAASRLRLWNGLSQGITLLTLGGLAYYLWRMTMLSEGPRFIPAPKFRG
ncbi:MAG: DUF4149 domain-containing protein [Verrucomicrobia bacterium]|nr:DUF4149 domain-containing protein [Verrucomicrobiota bacterium]